MGKLRANQDLVKQLQSKLKQAEIAYSDYQSAMDLKLKNLNKIVEGRNKTIDILTTHIKKLKARTFWQRVNRNYENE